MRKTKIVCTLGPASETEEIITGLCKAGMNVVRLNFSHGTHADHQKHIDTVKSVREKLGLPIMKKPKTGYSPNADLLEKLKDKHPIIPAIMDYRMLPKLKSSPL